MNELNTEDILKQVERNNDQQRSQHAYRDSVPGIIALLPTLVASDMYSHTNPCHARLRARESQELWPHIHTANHGHVGVHFKRSHPSHHGHVASECENVGLSRCAFQSSLLFSFFTSFLETKKSGDSRVVGRGREERTPVGGAAGNSV